MAVEQAEARSSGDLIYEALEATEREMDEVIRYRNELAARLIRDDDVPASMARQGIRLGRLIRQHAALQRAQSGE